MVQTARGEGKRFRGGGQAVCGEGRPTRGRPRNVRHMLKKGCLAYLAYIHNSSSEVPSMDSIPFVHEFPEVFPLDLSRMSSERNIDFYIDLAPGTQPISIPPYHMAPPELKELKEKLQDLLDKGFIRPSVSH
ncbi:uncharacterized protein [Nicotiana sylvestris]|uniref:uncharacterized protein n=1 Tax=Nicotiana sylvestris TaxID=4096 RepID=UPI00388C5576